jgi:hypothetical protein
VLQQNTGVKYSCTSAVYDELFIFNVKNLDKEQFEEGVIRIGVYDANSVPSKHASSSDVIDKI